MEAPRANSVMAYELGLSAPGESQPLHYFPSGAVRTDPEADYVDRTFQRPISGLGTSDASILGRLQEAYVTSTAASLVDAGAQYAHYDEEKTISLAALLDYPDFGRPTKSNDRLNVQSGIVYINLV